MASPSPKKSLSVRCDADGRLSIHMKYNQNLYKSVANFCFHIKNFVIFNDNVSKYNGYLLDVERRDGVKM